ncbi:MAG TPA: nuclear transport factor 2 family protein [Ramlibacter sp.]|nr:nuclear transport factor 2 family protein [Ramlibacter sp.]
MLKWPDNGRRDSLESRNEHDWRGICLERGLPLPGGRRFVPPPSPARKRMRFRSWTNGPRRSPAARQSSWPRKVGVTGLDTVTGVRDGNPVTARGRVTFVIARRGADWQIVHFHRSAMPN